MAARIPARLTVAEGRRFGLTVGGAFLLLMAVSSYRGHGTTALVTGCIGVALVLAGLLVPTHMGPVERAWMRMALVMSRVTTPFAMALVYFLAITPVGLVRKAMGHDPLRHAADQGTFWKSRPARAGGASSMQRQF
jgi:saxitoxin biosynthesis operon SxtJ-like protein